MADPNPAGGRMRVHILYSLPMIALGMLNFVFDVYLLKFSTDTLLLSPATMGAIFSASRIWDAFSDPAAGYLSDATRNSFGRRRTWMLASALPLWAAFYATFSPPALERSALTGWMLPSILAYFTAKTAFEVPHLGFGTELTQDAGQHERSALFTWRSGLDGGGKLTLTRTPTLTLTRDLTAILTLPCFSRRLRPAGKLLGVLALNAMMSEEPAGPAAVREAATAVALLGGCLATATILVLVFSLREPPGPSDGEEVAMTIRLPPESCATHCHPIAPLSAIRLAPD